MNTASEWRRKWAVNLAFAFLAASAGCKSPTRPEANEDWRYIQTQVNFREILLHTSDKACAEYAEETAKERAAIAALSDPTEHPNDHGK